MKNNTSLTFETVISTHEKLDFVKRAKQADFFTRLFFICTNDSSINAQWVVQRVMERGHSVLIPKIINRYESSITSCVRALPWLNRMYLYDNSITDATPKLLIRLNDGIIAKSTPNNSLGTRNGERLVS